MALVRSYDLTDVESVQLYLEEDGNEALFATMIKGLSDFIQGVLVGDISQGGYCNRRFIATDYTSALYTGNDRKNLLLRQWPINSVTTIVIDGTTIFPSGSSALADLGFYIDSDISGNLIYCYNWNSWMPNNIEITYNAGYSEIPFDLQLAVIGLISIRWKQKGTEGFKSEKLKNYSYALADLSELNPFGDGTGTIKDTLDQYKRPML